MLSLPIPFIPREIDTHDGLPCVHMPDPAEDLSLFLQGIYNPPTLPLKPLNPNKPVLIRGAPNLATKYQAAILRSYIVQSIEADWPQSLEDWHTLQNKMARIKKQHLLMDGYDGKNKDGLYFDDVLPEPGSAIALAREHGISGILPAAFYALLHVDPKSDWDEARDPSRDPNIYRLYAGDRTARWSLLHGVDFRLLIKLRDDMPHIMTNSVYTINEHRERQCTNPDGCEGKKDKFGDEWLEIALHWFPRDYLNGMRKTFGWEVLCGTDICFSCVSNMHSKYESVVEDFWTDLPHRLRLE